MASKKFNQAVENAPATERIGTTTIENNNVPATKTNTAKEINVMLTNSNNADVTLINSLKQLEAMLNNNRYYISDYCFDMLIEKFSKLQNALNDTNQTVFRYCFYVSNTWSEIVSFINNERLFNYGINPLTNDYREIRDSIQRRIDYNIRSMQNKEAV